MLNHLLNRNAVLFNLPTSTMLAKFQCITNKYAKKRFTTSTADVFGALLRSIVDHKETETIMK